MRAIARTMRSQRDGEFAFHLAVRNGIGDRVAGSLGIFPGVGGA